MNGDADNLITISIDGLDSEGGHIRLDEFLDKLNHLLVTLNGIDRLVGQTGNPTLYYRITKASHASPLTFTFEPVVRQGVPRPSGDYINARHSRFFRELGAIKKGDPISEEIDDSLLEHLRDLTAGLGSTFKKVIISNGHDKIDLDREFETGIRRILNEEDASYGAAQGTLEAVNIHGGARRFWIYPQPGIPRIRCDFLPGTQEQVREALGRYIRVEGVKFFRAQSPYPVRISVREFEILTDEEPVRLSELGGISPAVTGAMDSVAFVRAIRDEWD